MSTDKESSAAGTDNRPPMLVESDYESWKIRIERYIHGKTLDSYWERDLGQCRATNERFGKVSQSTKEALFLINDMKITQLNIPTHQMNTKFVNNLPPYWAKYVTNVKNNKDISATTYVELYTYLKSYEPHAMKTLKKQEQSTSTVDPLAYLAQPTHYMHNSNPLVPPPHNLDH
ncbi:hypothetical protein Tco_0630058 [Tanacetum coccineum]